MGNLRYLKILIQTFLFLYLCVHIRKLGCKIMCEFCPGWWNTLLLYIFSLLLSHLSVAAWNIIDNWSLGIQPLQSAAVTTGFPLLCLSAHQYPGSSQADPCSMGQKRAVLIQETEGGRPELRCSVFSCLPVWSWIRQPKMLCFTLQLLFSYWRR